ncbi:MAG: hypothetical protein AB7T31_08280 [Gemmatimonadales bacterium]
MRHTFVRALVGALASTLPLMTAACAGDGGLAPNQGRVRIVLGAAESPVALMAPASGQGESRPDSAVSSDDMGSDSAFAEPGHPGYPDHRPIPMYRSVEVTFSSILARNLDGVLVDVAMDLPVTVDASLLETGRQIELPEGELPAGTYDEVVFVVRKVEVVLWNETKVTIEPPGGGWTAHVPLCPRVEVEEGGTSVVSLRLQVWNAIFWSGDRLHFEPQPLFFWPGSCWTDVPPVPMPL